ncbi:hypothetical protein BLNAU_14391 [Blattamonas nauphoetae]|uniref:Uncharacterized protein n=1 Tax=Blattamonas nauphoetae TaxID=2049346 RepID=A0ABQ9XH27_9EUKA|nr:hypothetical protein BLNAU_14391 [Blattamonas nauphoetae]
MVPFAGTIGILSRQSHPIVATLSFSFITTLDVLRAGGSRHTQNVLYAVFLPKVRNWRGRDASLTDIRGDIVSMKLSSTLCWPVGGITAESQPLPRPARESKDLNHFVALLARLHHKSPFSQRTMKVFLICIPSFSQSQVVRRQAQMGVEGLEDTIDLQNDELRER